MRIIRTAIRKDRKKAAALLTACVSLLPAAAYLAVSALPSWIGLSFPVKAGVTGLFVDNVGVNNGSQLLFVPEEAGIPEFSETGAPVGEADAAADDAGRQRDIKSLLLTENLSSAREDLTAFSSRSGVIVEETFTSSGGEAFIDLPDGGQLRNCTDLSPEYVRSEAAKPSGIAVELWSDEPQVLIIHTHTSESYEPYEKDWFDDSYTSRSDDPMNSVVAVGNAIAEELAASGINVIHDCTAHDEVYKGAYLRSLDTALGVMERYPSVKVVLDVHRDAIENPDGTRVSAVAEIDGRKAAQVMIISAADDGSYDIPDYIENMHFACELQQAMESRYSGLTRPVLFQYCQYNQQISTGALLLEVGSHGNSTEQAVYSGQLIGRSLAALLCEKAEEIAVPCAIPLYFVDRLR